MIGKKISPRPSLAEIMGLAKSNVEQASQYILNFVQEKFSDLKIVAVQINQSKISLNSVNGLLTDAGSQQYFFKFHAEEGETKTMRNEYYQGQELMRAGLPVIKPLFESTVPGNQFLIYENITAPTAFEEFGRLEEGYGKNNMYDVAKETELLGAERCLLEEVAAVQKSTLEEVSATQMVDAPLYQLFYRRLVSSGGETPRVDLYYTGKQFDLPDGTKVEFGTIAGKTWVINGRHYNETLDEIIERAKELLSPLRTETMPTVIGHGDDHNGNKFLIDGKFVFFDPAFAGRQPALLSSIKATAHNTFLHPHWLYESERLPNVGLEFDWKIDDSTITVNSNWGMKEQSPIRQKLLELQANVVWRPLIAELRERKLLSPDWREYIRKALFCCPFLVYNLLDRKKYSPTATLLALSKCVELGSSADKKTAIDIFLESIEN